MLAATLGVIAGLVMGLTGAGGGILSVPLLVWGLGLSHAEALPVALATASVAAVFGTVVSWDVKLVRYKAATLMAVAGALAVPAGVALGEAVAPDWRTLGFAVLSGYLAVRNWRTGSGARTLVGRSAPVRLDPDTGRIAWSPAVAGVVSVCGAGAGFFAGLFGLSGGFFIGPGLRAFSELSIQAVVATSLMATALITASGVVILSALGQPPDLAAAVPFGAGALAGIFAGRRLAARIPPARMQRIFAGMLAVSAVAMFAHA